MRFLFGVLIPLLLQVPVSLLLIFGDIIKTPGGSFVPLLVMLAAGPLTLVAFGFNCVRSLRESSTASTAWLLIAGTATAMVVPVIQIVLLVVGPVFLN